MIKEQFPAIGAVVLKLSLKVQKSSAKANLLISIP